MVVVNSAYIKDVLYTLRQLEEEVVREDDDGIRTDRLPQRLLNTWLLNDHSAGAYIGTYTMLRVHK